MHESRSRSSSRRIDRFRLSLFLFLLGLTLLWPSEVAHLASTLVTPTPTLDSSSLSIEATEPIKVDPLLLASKSVKSHPIRIIIPSVGIDLAVTSSQVKKGFWEVATNSASFGIGSAPPGESGNTVIFAHARPGLFLPLRKVTLGNSIYVFTSTSWHRYKISNIKTVKPDQTEVVSPTSSEILTLFTCSGFQDSLRLIVQAIPEP